MRNRVLIILAASLVLLCGSGCFAVKAISSMMEEKKPDEPQPGQMQQERDPVPGMAKNNQGIHYDPREWVANTYSPDSTAYLITSTSENGMTQQTFAEAGGCMQVHVDPQGKRMVFASTMYSKTPQICMQGTAAKAVTLLTEDTMSDMMPKFSPDGKLIAWCSDRYGNWDILLQNGDATPDSRPRQLTRSTDDEIHPTWSIDGRLVAFSRFNSMDGLWQIWVTDLKTRSISFVSEGLFPEFRTIPENLGGKTVYTLAYQRHRKRDIPWYSVWTIAVTVNDAGAVEAVNAPQEIIANDQWAAITPSWSPDGNYLVFASVRKSALAQWQARIYKPDDVWVVRVDGTDLTQITRHSAPDWNPTWAKEDNNLYGRIYFTSERTGHANIWSVRPVIAGLVAGDDGAMSP